jgi:hypothetical protein
MLAKLFKRYFKIQILMAKICEKVGERWLNAKFQDATAENIF